MKITRERPCQRRHHRLTAPLHVIFEGQPATLAHDWRVNEETGIVGFQFIELAGRSSDLLNYFSADLIRGRMGTFEDSICRIDVPITPISTKPTPSPQFTQSLTQSLGRGRL